jgi:hypothetical protein
LKNSISLSRHADGSSTATGVGGPFFILCILCFLPTLLFYFFMHDATVTSLAPGTLIACIIFLGLVALQEGGAIPAVRLANYVSLAGVIAGAIVIHLVGSIAVGSGTEPGRALLSLPLLMVLLGGAIALATLLRQHAGSLNEAIALMRWLLVGLTILAAIDIHPWQGDWEKPVFPFSEPSHLALVLSPFLMHACIVHRGLRRALWIAASFALAYAIQSLTMILAMMVVAAICLPLAGFIAASAVAIASIPFIDLDYFVDRLDFNAGTRNASSLIYRQGWELIGDQIERTSGWGAGFQQLGYAPFRSPSADALYSIVRNDVNTRDGGFLLAKIVSEFGYVGAVIVLAYLVVTIRAALMARRFALKKDYYLPPHAVIALCVICCSTIEMFVRTTGYFSGSVLFLVSSFYILWECRLENKRSRDFATTDNFLPGPLT